MDMDVAQTITIDDTVIQFDDILSIEAEDESLFKQQVLNNKCLLFYEQRNGRISLCRK